MKKSLRIIGFYFFFTMWIMPALVWADGELTAPAMSRIHCEPCLIYENAVMMEDVAPASSAGRYLGPGLAITLDQNGEEYTCFTVNTSPLFPPSAPDPYTEEWVSAEETFYTSPLRKNDYYWIHVAVGRPISGSVNNGIQWSDWSDSDWTNRIGVYTGQGKNISRAAVKVENQVYAPDPWDREEPKVTVTLDGWVLEEDTDYYIDAYNTDGNAGTSEVTVQGEGNYSGEVSGTYEILPLDISRTADITVEDQYQEYAGEVMRPSVEVKYGDLSLAEGVDYEITGYSNNAKLGMASVKVKFIGNYTGTAETSFEVIRNYDLYVGGVRVNSKNAAGITGGGISGKVSYDAASNTLCLTNASITGHRTISHGYAGSETYGIDAGKLTILLNGTNSLDYSVRTGALTITGKGSLELSGKSNLPSATGLTCTSLLVSKGSTFTILKSSAMYGNQAAKVSNKLDVRGTMNVTVPSGAPAQGISCGSADISGILNITVKSAYTNSAYGLKSSGGAVNVSGTAIVDTSGTKKGWGILASSLTVTNSGSLTVTAREKAGSVNKLVLGKNLTLQAGSGKLSAVPVKAEVKKLEEYSYIKIYSENSKTPSESKPESETKPGTDSKPETETEKPAETTKKSTPKVGTKLTDSGSGLIYSVSKKGKEVSVKGVSKKEKTITIPKTVKLKGIKYKVTAISANAFKGNKNIQTVTVGSNVVKIGQRAFSGCKVLKQVTLSSSVKSLGKETFLNSKKLSKITIKTTKLTSKTVGSNAFKGIYAKVTVKVPKSKLKAYTTLLKKKGAPKKVEIK